MPAAHAHPSIHAPQPALHRASELPMCPPWHRPSLLQTQGDRQKPQSDQPGLCQQTSRNMRAGVEKDIKALRRNVEREKRRLAIIWGRRGGSSLRSRGVMRIKFPDGNYPRHSVQRSSSCTALSD